MFINRRGRALIVTIVAAATVPAAALGAGPSWTLQVSPQSLVQGQTVRVRIRGAVDAGDVRITVGSTQVKVHRLDGGLEGFVGTSPLTAPGTLTLRARVRSGAGLTTRTLSLRIWAGAFGTRRLSVPPALLDPALVAIERRKVAAALAAPLPTPLWRGAFR
ncbi:MAG: hypothetical protein ACRDHY_09315, partial [Anaerolineales bacterium]